MARDPKGIVPSDPKANFELCSLPDCIHLGRDGGCCALRVERCSGSGCSFLKLRSDSNRISASWHARLCSLSAAEQSRLANKYYGGAKPWKTGGENDV